MLRGTQVILGELEFRGGYFDPRLEFKSLTQYLFQVSTVPLTGLEVGSLQFPSGVWRRKLSLLVFLVLHLAHLEQGYLLCSLKLYNSLHIKYIRGAQ